MVDQQEILIQAYEAVKKYGTIAKAAEVLNVPRVTLSDRFRRAMNSHGLADPREEPAFVVEPLPDKVRSLDEIMKHRKEEAGRSMDWETAAKLIKVTLKTPGPIGLLIMGDPHLDNPGCDFSLLEAHMKLIADRKQTIYAGNIGDVRDNWIGRLERLYADTTISAKETWKLVEWMFQGSGVQWTWLVRGNHDHWAGINDPLDWISKGGGVGVDQNAGVRIAFQHPNGAQTRLHARHDFAGNSIYNPLHALKREVLYGFRDHVIVAGHRHIGADARDVNGEGMPFVMVRVSGYKVSDPYRHTIGAHAKPLHPSAMIIVDPDEPENSVRRIFTAPCVEDGADYLDFKRDRFNSRPRPTAKKGTK